MRGSFIRFLRCFGLFRPKINVNPLLNDILKAVRRPEAYRDFGVEDSLEGRFERLILLSTLVLRHLKTLPKSEEAQQLLVDAIFDHLDGALRQTGVSDIRMGKVMKKRAREFYGRLQAYDQALSLCVFTPQGDFSSGEVGLREVLSRNLFASKIAPEAISSSFLQEIAQDQARLEVANLDEILQGDVLQQAQK